MPVWSDFLRALALVLIVEGLWPFISPSHWRNLLTRVADMDDRTLRITGLVSIGIGLIVLRIVQG